MAKASITIANGANGFMAHNSRESFSKSQVFFDEENDISHTKKEAFLIYRDELEKRKTAYEERTKQKLQKKTITHISAIVNLEKHHTMQDLNLLKDELEKRFDTKVFQASIHRDEGKLVHKETEEILTSGEDFFCNPKNKKLYFDKDFKNEIPMQDWKIEKNYHAHLEMMGIDSQGKSIRRSFNSRNLSELQDLTAKILKMERGHKWQPSYTIEQMKEIKSKLKPKKSYKNDKEYGMAFKKIAQELGYYEPKPRRSKRLDTHEYKATKAKENKDKANAKALEAELKKEIGWLRSQLRENQAKRPDYAKMEQLNKDLKKQIIESSLTSIQLKEEVQRLAHELLKEKGEATEIKESLMDYRGAVDEWVVAFKELEADYERLKDEYKKLKAENESLKKELTTKNEESIDKEETFEEYLNQSFIMPISKDEETTVLEDEPEDIEPEKESKPKKKKASKRRFKLF